MIVSCALEIASNGIEFNVVADDTDVLILLMYHWRILMSHVYFLSEPKRAQKKGLQVWSISDLITKAGGLVTSHLLFIHSWSGCDTTSATFGHGKTNLLKKIQVSEEVQQKSVLMSDPHMTADEIGKDGIRLFIILFGGKPNDSLNVLRYAKFMDMVSSSIKAMLDPQKLPPTERAAHFHSLRVYFQVVLWKTSHIMTYKWIMKSGARSLRVQC